MYYRRKLLLSILQEAREGKLSKTGLQKTLFLISKKQDDPCFDFVPCKHGCFSFQANKDLEVLASHYRLIKGEGERWSFEETKERHLLALKKTDQQIISAFFEKNKVENTQKLIKATYDLDPYYTIKSERKLSRAQSNKRDKEVKKIQTKKRKLFSIGYEGISIDAYLNKLVKNGISLLCDVRRNPFSMKYGFSKSQLSRCCKNLDIEYSHIPSFGIRSERRKNLVSPEDYKNLFKSYRKSLRSKKDDFEELEKLLKKYNRVALSCFEKDHRHCHRSVLIDFYEKNIKEVACEHL